MHVNRKAKMNPPDPSEQETQNSVAEVERLRKDARTFRNFGAVCFVVAIGFALIGNMANSVNPTWFYGAGAAFVFGMFLYIFAQLVHIRAGLENLSQKPGN
jgi:hypothetical protein